MAKINTESVEVVPVPVVPALSDTQKLVVREQQLVMSKLESQYQTLNAQIFSDVQKFARQQGFDPEKLQFDFDNLVYKVIEKATE